MTVNLNERLNEILPRITDPDFLAGKGIGNEIACYLFDYPAADELKVREHLALIEKRLTTHHQGISFVHINLLDEVFGYLQQRKLLEKAFDLQKNKGDKALLQALRGPLSAEKLRDHIAGNHDLPGVDLILMSGVGGVWPMLRAHNLLNCLHAVIGDTPLVMFYPGTYDGTALYPFGERSLSSSTSAGNPYYRAFILVPGGPSA